MNETETRAEHIDLSDSGLVRELAGMRRNWICEYTAYLELLNRVSTFVPSSPSRSQS